MANRVPEKKSGGSWAAHAFPPEAGMNYDEVALEVVLASKARHEGELTDEKWEVIDGLNFPYANFA
ncbi:hypothetical protein [Paenirhodobacter sp. CAU 1674]|uniref:hypothetical protein n=1 Tax=Paenirhodobacter sp. CAU 1674 TaxID=3032596 RepID=UPI0023DAA7CD|nr:hypothetical protein [Paenirhodobacter sp. CAU 1674]MDF2141728.1 hypothetical protein [Paenirhodobacter sp. CAU 1674]